MASALAFSTKSANCGGEMAQSFGKKLAENQKGNSMIRRCGMAGAETTGVTFQLKANSAWL
jgi:hypothetical protein